MFQTTNQKTSYISHRFPIISRPFGDDFPITTIKIRNIGFRPAVPADAPDQVIGMVRGFFGGGFLRL